MKNLLPIIILILLGIILILVLRKNEERYQPLSNDNEDDDKLYRIIQTIPQLGRQPDELFLYEIFPTLTISDLKDFARISSEGDRLVKKYLRILGIKLNPNVFNELILFTETSTQADNIETEILQNLFNTLSPNSSRFISIRGEPVLALNTSLLPITLIKRKVLNRGIEFYLKREIKPDTNLKVFIRPQASNSTNINIEIFIRKNTNIELINKLLELGVTLETTFNIMNPNDLQIIPALYFIDNNNKIDRDVPQNTFTAYNEEDYREILDRNEGILFIFNLPDVRLFDSKSDGFDEIIAPKIVRERKEREEKERKEREENKRKERQEKERKEEEEKEYPPPTEEDISTFLNNLKYGEPNKIFNFLKEIKDKTIKRQVEEIIGYLRSENYEKYKDMFNQDILRILKNSYWFKQNIIQEFNYFFRVWRMDRNLRF